MKSLVKKCHPYAAPCDGWLVSLRRDREERAADYKKEREREKNPEFDSFLTVGQTGSAV